MRQVLVTLMVLALIMTVGCSGSATKEELIQNKLQALGQVRVEDWYPDKVYSLIRGPEGIPGTPLWRVIVLREHDNEPFPAIVTLPYEGTMGERVSLVEVSYWRSTGRGESSFLMVKQ